MVYVAVFLGDKSLFMGLLHDAFKLEFGNIQYREIRSCSNEIADIFTSILQNILIIVEGCCRIDTKTKYILIN